MAGNVRFCGASYWLANRKAEVQRTVNLYTAQAYDMAKGRDIRLDSIPGLVKFSDADPVPPGPGCRYVFLDTFTHDGEPIDITEHTQDIPLNGSIWDVNDTSFWRIYDNQANAVPDALTGNTTSFGTTVGGYRRLDFGWRFEVDIEIPLVIPTVFAQVDLSGYVGDTGSRYVDFQIKLEDDGAGSNVVVKIGADSQYFAIAPGMHTFVCTMGAEGMTVTVDDVPLEVVPGTPYTWGDTFRVPASVGLWCQSIGSNSYMNVGRVGIYTCGPLVPWFYPD